MATDSKYTIDTGDGYLGIRSCNNHVLKIALGTLADVSWEVGMDLHVRDADVDPGIVVQEEEPEHCIGTAVVKQDTSGPVAHVHPRAIRWLDVPRDADCRIYCEPAGDGLLVVPAGDRDPMLGDQDG